MQKKFFFFFSFFHFYFYMKCKMMNCNFMSFSTVFLSYLDNEWMDDSPFYVLFNSISVISGQWAGDNGSAMEPHFNMIEKNTASGWAQTLDPKSVGQH